MDKYIVNQQCTTLGETYGAVQKVNEINNAVFVRNTRVIAFPWEPKRAFCGFKPREPFDYGPPMPLCLSILDQLT
eukprot:2302322-Pleurochrysis_carterae.AAC.1